MKPLKKIRRNSAIRILEATIHGGSGVIHLDNMTCSVMWGADENGWEHVSISPYPETVTPSWNDMCAVKDMFWEDDEAVLQIHPPKKKYVNLMQNCLHLWRPKAGIHGMNPEWDEVSE